MPLYMDRHDLSDATAADVAVAHMRDLEVQDGFDVRFVTYWFEADAGSGFCLVEGPDAEAAFRAILFTDIVDSTRLTQELGDRAAMRFLRAHDSVVRAALARFGGSEVKHTGDGIMAAFTSAFQAVSAAMRIQRALQERNEPSPGELHVRVGVAAGEPVTEHDDLFGAAVQQAARLCARARPDCIVVSSAVHDLCRGKGIRFSDGGAISLKGFDEPIGHFEAEWRD
jgi:class 3 adenylate cyclase